MSPFRGKLFEKVGRLARSQAEHEAGVKAILANDADAAAEVMREHISIGCKVFADLVLSNKLLEFARLSVDQDDAHRHRGQRTQKTGRDAFTQPQRAKQQRKERRQKHKH